jgi:predicted dehydrogenase
MPVYRVKIIGTGRIAGIKDDPLSDTNVAYTHAKAIHLHSGFKLTGACDENRQKAEAFGAKWDIRTICQSVSELLETEPAEVIVVCSPTDCHFEQLKEVLTSKQPPRIIFVEKPACEDKIQYDEILSLCQSRQVEVLVNHTRRFDPDFRNVAELIQSGELGSLIQGNGTYYGGILNNGVHMVDTLRLLLGQEPVVLGAKKQPYGRNEDICVDFRLGFQSGEIELTTFNEEYYQLFELELRFEKGRASFRDFGAEIHLEKPVENILGELELKPVSEYPCRALGKPLYHAFDLMYQHLEGKSHLKNTGAIISDAGPTMKNIWDAMSMSS